MQSRTPGSYILSPVLNAVNDNAVVAGFIHTGSLRLIKCSSYPTRSMFLAGSSCLQEDLVAERFDSEDPSILLCFDCIK